MQASGDMAGAQTVILQELQKEFGGSAEAAGKTFSGQLAILGNAFGEVQESLAVGLMPYLQEFLDFVIKHMPEIQEFITKAMDASNESFERVWKVVDRLIKIFQDLYEIVEPLMPALDGLFRITMSNINGYIDGTITIVESLVKAIQSAIDITKAFMKLEGATSAGGRLAEEGLRGYANGGRFSAGQLMRVGESGPKLVAFGASGTVIPNRAMSGGNTTVNNYITVNDGFNGVKRELNRMGLSTP
jgi:phage-related protein